MKRSASEETSDKQKQQKVHPFFSQFDQSLASVAWKQHDSILYAVFADPKPSAKIAAFDLDDTIITTASRRVFAKTPDDWKFLYDFIPKKLSELLSAGFRVVFFSNQQAIGKSEEKTILFKNKLANILRALKLPVLIMAATRDDHCRKPNTGMFDFLIHHHNSSLSVDYSASFYCGDAAGRPQNWKPGNKKDFADSDRKFARNLGLKFYTPEEYFHSASAAPFAIDFDPELHITESKELPLFTPTNMPLHRDKMEIIVFVGLPASGKTTFYEKYLAPHDYVHVNQDKLKSRDRCVAEVAKLIASKKRIVVDNTNPDKATRKHYIDVAHKNQYEVRCFWFQTPNELCLHNNMYRHLVHKTREKLPGMAFRGIAARFETPSTTEGFVEVKKINFVPEFENEDEKKKWCKFYV